MSIFHRLYADREGVSLWLLFTFGALMGVLLSLSVDSCTGLCTALLAEPTDVVSLLLSGLLPLAISGGCASLWPQRNTSRLPLLYSGFLLTFAVGVFLQGLGPNGWLLSVLLLSGPAGGLCALFWFCLRRNRWGTEFLLLDFLRAAGVTLLSQICSLWLFSNALESFRETLF